MDPLELMRRRLEREKKARQAAEAIVEQSSRELFLKNQQLDRTAKRMATFLPPQLLPLMSDLSSSLGELTSRCYLTVTFIDVSGFTALTEELEPEVVVATVNDYFGRVVNCAELEGGLVDKFMGDGALIFFGSPLSKGRAEDAGAALRFALKMQASFKELCAQWRNLGVDHRLGLRIGVNSGFCTVGNFGSERRFQFTALGSTVNLASRMEKQAAPGQIICTFSTSAIASGEFNFQPLGERQIKGVAKPMPVFEVREPNILPRDQSPDVRLTNFLCELSTTIVDRATMDAIAKLAERHWNKQNAEGLVASSPLPMPATKGNPVTGGDGHPHEPQASTLLPRIA